MSEPAKNIPVSQFKTKCLAILDEMSKTGFPMIVTKRGKPIAKIIPVGNSQPLELIGSVSYKSEGDLLGPINEI
jgi:prevent-host-death family protein